jgi:hypothetical protein
VRGGRHHAREHCLGQHPSLVRRIAVAAALAGTSTTSFTTNTTRPRRRATSVAPVDARMEEELHHVDRVCGMDRIVVRHVVVLLLDGLQCNAMPCPCQCQSLWLVVMVVVVEEEDEERSSKCTRK